MLVVVVGWHRHTSKVCREALPLLVPIHGCQGIGWATPAHHHAAATQSLLGSAHDYLLLLGHRGCLQGRARGVQHCSGRPAAAEAWQAGPVPPEMQFAAILQLSECKRNGFGWCTCSHHQLCTHMYLLASTRAMCLAQHTCSQIHLQALYKASKAVSCYAGSLPLQGNARVMEGTDRLDRPGYPSSCQLQAFTWGTPWKPSMT